MRCFNHSDNRAVGICKYCGKGVCKECAADLGFALACKNLHESAVEKTHAFVAKGQQLVKINSKIKFAFPIFCILLGVLYCYQGFTSIDHGHFTVIAGSIFIAFGIIMLVANKSSSNKPKA